MREDIVGGLRNALERGATLEQAIQSFVSAGYNDVEVREAANQISPGAAMPALTPKIVTTVSPPQQNIPASSPPQKLPTPLRHQEERPNPKKRVRSKGTGRVILLLIILLILIGALVTTIIFRDQVIGFLTDLL